MRSVSSAADFDESGTRVQALRKSLGLQNADLILAFCHLDADWQVWTQILTISASSVFSAFEL